MRLRGGSGPDVTGHHASVGAGPVTIMEAATGPTAAGHAHDFDGDAVGPLSRVMPSAAARLSESVRLLRLG
jgi:hypothetical protein